MIKRPNPFVWLPLAGLLKLSSIFQGGRVIRRVKIKKPAIILSNHTSFRDYVFVNSAFYPHRITYLAASKMFYEPSRRGFLRLARAIPKASFESDTRAVMDAFKILRQNGILSIFPEGQISYHGTSLRPPFSIAKFLKKAGVNVYVAQIQNGYLMSPPWSKYVFKGKVFLDIFQLFTPEQLKEYDETAIFDAMNEKLSFNTGEYNRKHRHRYKIRPIDNLENVLYQCPECRHEGLTAVSNRLTCPSCGHALVYDQFGMLNGMSVYELFEEQRRLLIAAISVNPAYELTAHVRLVKEEGNTLVPVGAGVISLNRERYEYKGTDKGENVTYRFSTKSVEYLPSDIGDNIQIYNNRQVYMFRMDDPKLPTKFVIAGEYFYRAQNHLAGTPKKEDA